MSKVYSVAMQQESVAAPVGSTIGLDRAGEALRRMLQAWRQRREARRALRQLRELPDHLLRDMGLIREDLHRASRRGFFGVALDYRVLEEQRAERISRALLKSC